MLFLGHPGRFVGIVAPWAALLLRRRLDDRRVLVAVVFATLGLGFVSMHVTVYVVGVLVLAWLWERLPRRRSLFLSRPRPQWALHALALGAIAAPLVTFGLLRRVGDPTPLVAFLLLGTIVGMAGLALTAVGGTSLSLSAPRWRASAGWVGFLVLGFILSNAAVVLSPTVADLGVRGVLGAVLPGYDIPLQTRGLLDAPISGLTFFKFAGGECPLSGHCLSIGGYLGSYGFISILAVAGWFAMGRPAGADTDGNHWRAAWLGSVVAFCLSFVLIDFTGAPADWFAWILTRFIEVPYYGLLALATIALVGSRDRLTAIVGAVVIGAWTVVPLVYNLVPLQLIRNADWLERIIS